MDPFSVESNDDTDQYDTPDDEDGDILCGGMQSLGIEYNYVSDWKPPHAIREYHQNWKDGIKEATGLRNRDFIIQDNGFDSRDVYTIEARHPDTRELLGFIQWKQGTIQYSNFGAQLQRKALNFGVSTKRDDDDLAGVHGEGFKVASLVMIRSGYRVRYETSRFYWNFQFRGRNGDILYCKLTKMDGKKLEKQIEEYKAKTRGGSARELKANIWEDVTVNVGRIQGRGNKVERADFLTWIKVSLDLDCPSKIIRTLHGSLILDDDFKGRIYLKGLLLEGEPVSPYKFCYDFYNGKVNRDRQRLSSPREEAKTLAKIWGEAVKLDEAAALPELMELLQADTVCADVNLAEEHMSIETAQTIWQKLREENAEGSLFYYYGQNGHHDVELITRSLQKKPVPLKKATWLSLRRFGLIRTPEEHRHYLLETAPETNLPQSLYSTDVHRALMSVLALDSRTQNLRLDFRSGANAELDLLLHKSQLLINDKWLDFVASHKSSSCSLFLQATAEQSDIDRFSCSHIVKSLYDSVLVELSNGSNSQQHNHSNNYMNQLVSEKVDQMPCMVKVVQGEAAGVLEVSWVHAESEKISRLHHLELKGWITMHRNSTCSDKKSELLAFCPSEQELQPQGIDSVADCGCPEKIVLLREGRVVFVGLNHEEEYFPMVARTDTQALFALPPKAMRPKPPDVFLPDRAVPTPGPARLGNVNDFDHDDQNGGFESSSDGSDEDSSSMDLVEPLDGLSEKELLYGCESNITRPGRALWPRPEPPASPSQQLMVRKNRQIQQLRSEIEMQKELIYNRDQNLQSLETGLATLRSQLNSERQRASEFMDKAETQRALLALKEKELGKAKSERTLRDEAVDVTIEAMRVNQVRLSEFMVEVEGFLYLLESIHKEFRGVETQFANTNASNENELGAAMHTEQLGDKMQKVIQQSTWLITHLKHGENNVRAALGIVASDTSEVKASRNATKRKRVKEEPADSEDDGSPRPGAVKRARVTTSDQWG